MLEKALGAHLGSQKPKAQPVAPHKGSSLADSLSHPNLVLVCASNRGLKRHRPELYGKSSWERDKSEHTPWKNTNTFRLTLKP